MKTSHPILIVVLGLLPVLLLSGPEDPHFQKNFETFLLRFDLKNYRCKNIEMEFDLRKSHPSPRNWEKPEFTSKEVRRHRTGIHKGEKVSTRKNQKNHGRAFMESLSFMSVSAALYWWRWGLWAEDWQYSFTWEEQKLRFFTFEATKFDSNSFMTNFSHGPNGAIFYNFARTNHLSVAESTLYAIISSLFWEYVIEYKEIVSINDNLFNTFLGFSMGEPLFQLGHYLSHQTGTASKIFGIIFNPVLALNNWLSGKKGKLKDDRLLISQHNSTLIFGPIHGYGQSDPSRFNHFNIGFRSRLVSIPGYLAPGKSRMKLNNPFLSEVFADINLGTKEIEEFNIVTKATLLGYFSKNIKSTTEQQKGIQFFWGLGSAFDMFRRKSNAAYDTITSGSSQSERIEVTRPTEFSDKWAIINTLGPLFEFSAFLGSATIKLRFEAYFDFALINSLALSKYSDQNNLGGIKSTLSQYGYYYGYGFTALSSLNIQNDPFTLQTKLKYHQLESIDGLDRFQDYISDDFHLRDSRLLGELSLSYRFHRTPISCKLGYQRIIREGTIKDIHQRESEQRLYFQILVHFR